MDAPARVLVCYASAAGSTRGIGERIAERIERELSSRGIVGPAVLCRPASPDCDLDGLTALILGSAVHNMAWLPEATSVLARAAGASVPVWAFSVGGLEGRGPLTRMLVDRERARIERVFPVGLILRDHRVFGGVVVTTGAPLWARLFWRLTGGGPGDHRNWAAIEAWAAEIAADLAPGRGGHADVQAVANHPHEEGLEESRRRMHPHF